MLVSLLAEDESFLDGVKQRGVWQINQSVCVRNDMSVI